ncbi:MAG: hypothetical protein Q4E65_05275 [Clostridia bacterium]|nr:hypothetical protein [Clostridia bacterium]
MTKDENTLMHPIDDETLKDVSGGVVHLPPERIATLEFLSGEEDAQNQRLPGQPGKSRVRTLEQKDIPNLPRPPREI